MKFRPEGLPGTCDPSERTPMADAELEQLRVRVIALENLIVALLVRAPDCQRSVSRQMATYIRPRPGYTPHPLTLRASGAMLSLVDRADRYPARSTAEGLDSLEPPTRSR